MFSKILLCADGSEDALTAAKMVAQIAQKFPSTVLMIHTHDPAFTTAAAFGEDVWEVAANQNGHDAEVEDGQRKLIENTGNILLEAGVKYEPLRESGPPVEAIMRVAKELDIDLIAMGGRGASDGQAFLLGSVSEGVLHNAQCPVLIVRGDLARPLQHILLVSDGSEGVSQATAAAIEIARRFAGSLKVLNVLDASSIPSTPSPYPSADSDTPYTHAEHLLAQITEDVGAHVKGTGVACSYHQETGNPSALIVAFAGRNEIDLIVLGSLGQGASTSLLLGSVSNSVAHDANCPVLVMR
jgi:nucleotide-binding universal stress UspA family protein